MASDIQGLRLVACWAVALTLGCGATPQPRESDEERLRRTLGSMGGAHLLREARDGGGTSVLVVEVDLERQGERIVPGRQQVILRTLHPVHRLACIDQGRRLIVCEPEEKGRSTCWVHDRDRSSSIGTIQLDGTADLLFEFSQLLFLGSTGGAWRIDTADGRWRPEAVDTATLHENLTRVRLDGTPVSWRFNALFPDCAVMPTVWYRPELGQASARRGIAARGRCLATGRQEVVLEGRPAVDWVATCERRDGWSLLLVVPLDKDGSGSEFAPKGSASPPAERPRSHGPLRGRGMHRPAASATSRRPVTHVMVPQWPSSGIGRTMPFMFERAARRVGAEDSFCHARQPLGADICS